MEIEQGQAHEATQSVVTPDAAAPEPASQVSGGEAKPDAQPTDESYEEPKNLTPEAWAEKAAKYTNKTSKKAEKAAKSEEKVVPLIPPEKPEEGAETDEKPLPAAADGWKPKEKYTFTAIGKEYDLPKWAKESIKTPEQEKGFIEVFEKAMGLDHVKQRHQELFDKHSELQTNHQDLVGGVQELRTIYADALQTGNLLKLDDFFNILKIPPQVVLQYALKRAELEEMSPEQRQIVQGQMSAERQARELEKQNQSLGNSAQQAESRALGLLLDIELAKPDVVSVAQAYDSAPGRKPGDFRQRVVDHGEYVWLKSKGTSFLKPGDAVSQVIAQYGLTPAAPAPTSANPAQAQTQPTAKSVPAPHRDVPTIPAVTGKPSQSPMKSKVRSIDDIRRIQKEMAQASS